MMMLCVRSFSHKVSLATIGVCVFYAPASVGAFFYFLGGIFMAKLIIHWSPQIFFGGSYDVYLVNTYLGELSIGGQIEVQVDVGTHLLLFRQKGLGVKVDTSFNAVVNTPDEIVLLTAKFTSNGAFTIKYADNAPHIPPYDGAPPQSSESTATCSAIPTSCAVPTYSAVPTGFRKKRTVSCRTCGGQIAPSARKCPHCGAIPFNVALGDGITGALKAVVFFPFILILISISFALYIILF